jgi:hypothetical protein
MPVGGKEHTSKDLIAVVRANKALMQRCRIKARYRQTGERKSSLEWFDSTLAPSLMLSSKLERSSAGSYLESTSQSRTMRGFADVPKHSYTGVHGY